MPKRCRCGLARSEEGAALYCSDCQTFTHPAYGRYTVWCHIEPRDPEHEDWSAVEHCFTEAQILALYYRYWVSRMREVGKAHLINRRNCIEDWVVLHWASPGPCTMFNGVI